MPSKERRLHLPSILAGFWLAFSVSLAAWWLIFGLKQIDRMKMLQHELASEMVRQQRMVIWEGLFLILCLLAGGAALLYYIHQERKRSLQIREFFATFTHELKTSLASLRLQSESLQEDLRESIGSSKVLSRLVNDTVRLEVQLENSLFLAHADSSRLILEKVSVRKAVEAVARHWPGLSVQLTAEAYVRADERALDSVLKNLLQNAVVHGQATEVRVDAKTRANKVELEIKDNGKGFKGDTRELGRLFGRHYTKSGSGVGLYLASELMKKMGGSLSYLDAPNGFAVRLQFQEAA
ncbi:MAG TPA: HAMP domain-containing sensor histidine kinase [Bdellovibrionales bacterium]|nr:HAMP domain-containing sensor histidine kinase [Bdellovibrionales bacterium]